MMCTVQSEGVLGLYRGFGMSIATFVPTSGIWWGAYGAYQKLIWQQVPPAVLLKSGFSFCWASWRGNTIWTSA